MADLREDLANLIQEYMPGADGVADSHTITDAILASDLLAKVRAEARKDFADELTRKGVHTFDIHSIRNYADRIEKGLTNDQQG